MWLSHTDFPPHASSPRLKTTYNGAILTRGAHALLEQSLQDVATTTAGILRGQYVTWSV